MSALNFYGRVVIVTGAGRGIGRCYAKEFAKRGAMVIVNDVDKHGDEGTSLVPLAEQASDSIIWLQPYLTNFEVATEICDSGGKAIANFDNVEKGEKIIDKAITEFGKVDVVVNNAGILHDKSFSRMSEQEWEAVHEVHLKGAYTMAKAVWPHFLSRKYGRLIFVSSNSGIYGNFGQANYAAAKSGLLGLSKTLAIEGKKHHINSNVIVPTAASRMTENILPTELLKKLKPEAIAPMVVYLSHDSCKQTGKIFAAAGGWFGQVQYRRSRGKILNHISAEEIRDRISDISDMTNAEHFDSLQDELGNILQMMEQHECDSDHAAESVESCGSEGTTTDSNDTPGKFQVKL